jgi:hypothetical protein
MEKIMKKFIIALGALTLASTAALAERNYDISSPPFGESQSVSRQAGTSNDVLPFQAKVYGTDGVKDPASNDSSGSR